MKILVIDDDPDVVEVVSLIFEMRWPEAIAVSANDGGSGLDLVRIENPDVIILDIGLPDMDGFEVCKEIRSFSNTPIVMLTVRDKEADIVRCLQIGADDYIIKPFRHMELLARVQAVLRRAQMEPVTTEEEPFQSGNVFIDFSRREVSINGQLVKLTATEYQLLYHLVKNAGRVMPHSTLLGRIWGKEYVNASNYLFVHIQHLRQKLGDDPTNPTLILTERGAGYRFSG